MSQLTAIAPHRAAGDFARGQRNGLRVTQTDCDFATGMRLNNVPRTTGDFCSGMRTVRWTAAVIGDFATGMRSASIPFVADDFTVEENVQLAA
jgi:hypothetical protein